MKGSQVTRFNHILSMTDFVQHVTLNVLGELSGDGCEELYLLLLWNPVSHQTSNIQLTDDILRCTARCVREQEKPY